MKHKCQLCDRPALSRRRRGTKGRPRKAVIEVKWRKGHDLCQHCFEKLLEQQKLKGGKHVRQIV